MKKRFFVLLVTLATLLTSVCMVHAEAKLTSDVFTIHVDIIKPEGTFIPSDLRFNLFDETGEWLGNQCISISADTASVSLQFPVWEYEIGKVFQVVATTGAEYVNYCDVHYALNEPIYVETYAYRDENGNVIISDEVHVTVETLSEQSAWNIFAENYVNEQKIQSDKPYLMWVSKANFKVNVFLQENGKWDCIKVIDCSIGAPETPTITGQYKYHQYQSKWDYGDHYVGPIMRFYGGYAIHSTLFNNDGSDLDKRIGKMISHGCVRVRSEGLAWLVYYIPLDTTIYLTDQ